MLPVHAPPGPADTPAACFSSTSPRWMMLQRRRATVDGDEAPRYGPQAPRCDELPLGALAVPSAVVGARTQTAVAEGAPRLGRPPRWAMLRWERWAGSLGGLGGLGGLLQGGLLGASRAGRPASPKPDFRVSKSRQSGSPKEMTANAHPFDALLDSPAPRPPANPSPAARPPPSCPRCRVILLSGLSTIGGRVLPQGAGSAGHDCSGPMMRLAHHWVCRGPLAGAAVRGSCTPQAGRPLLVALVIRRREVSGGVVEPWRCDALLVPLARV